MLLKFYVDKLLCCVLGNDLRTKMQLKEARHTVTAESVHTGDTGDHKSINKSSVGMY